MTIRPPKSLTHLPTQSGRRPSGADILEAEMRGEQAYALGLAAKKMEKALAEYRSSNGDPRRTQMAADAVYAFFIQRGMIGLTNQDYVIEYYDIPQRVLAKVGAKEM